MAMGTRRQRERQQNLWIASSEVVETPGNAFYDRLNQILDEHKFDRMVEAVCRKFYKKSQYGHVVVYPCHNSVFAPTESRRRRWDRRRI
jgi:hypothetical protein